MKKVKSILVLTVLFMLYSCNDDDNAITIEPISELTLNKLTPLNSNIPKDFYTDLTFTDENTGYAISRMGKIIKTTDSGKNWITLNSTVNFYLRRIQFVNASTGYVIGGNETGNYLLKTSNAGQTWKVTKLNNIENIFPTGIFFKTQNEGYITGYQTFIKTTDGGLTWNNVLNKPNQDFKDVKFRDPNFGVVTANINEYYITTNGGTSWQLFTNSEIENALNEIYFVYNKTYIKTANKLVDIDAKKSITIPNPISKLLFLDDKKCIGIGSHFETGIFPYGDILLTNTLWNTFLQKSYQPASEAQEFNTIARVNNRKAMIIGGGIENAKIITVSY